MDEIKIAYDCDNQNSFLDQETITSTNVNTDNLSKISEKVVNDLQCGTENLIEIQETRSEQNGKVTKVQSENVVLIEKDTCAVESETYLNVLNSADDTVDIEIFKEQSLVFECKQPTETKLDELSSENEDIGFERKTNKNKIFSDSEESGKEMDNNLSSSHRNNTLTKLSVLENNEEDSTMLLNRKKKYITDSDESENENTNDIVNDASKATLGIVKSDSSFDTSINCTSKSKRFLQLIDSDESSKSDDEREYTNNVKKKSKKFSKKKSKIHKSLHSESDSDNSNHSISAHGTKTRSSIYDEDSLSGKESTKSGSDNETHMNKIKQMNEKNRPAKRISAKEAEEQMKTIQSYSQKFAREANVNIPYHRPKQYTVSEFLNRPKVAKPALSVFEKKKTAAAIKMNREELIAYAKYIEQRQRVAEVFFKNERDVMDIIEKVENSKLENNEITSTKVSENIEKDQTEKIENSTLLESNETTITKAPGNIDVDTIEKMENSELLESNVTTTSKAPEKIKTQKFIFEGITNEDEAGTQVRDIGFLSTLDKIEKSDNANQTNFNPNEIKPCNIKSIESEIKILLKNDELKQISTKSSVEIDVGTSTTVNPRNKLESMTNIEKDQLELHNLNLDTDAHKQKDEIDFELKCFDIQRIPSFQGGPNSIIDLETGDILPKKLSGPDELLMKFMQHTKRFKSKDSTKSSSQSSIDPKLITFDINDDDTIVTKESKPGAAYAKLKKVLEEKIAKKRKEQCLQRMKEMQEEKEIEMEELSDCGYDETDDIDDNDENENSCQDIEATDDEIDKNQYSEVDLDENLEEKKNLLNIEENENQNEDEVIDNCDNEEDFDEESNSEQSSDESNEETETLKKTGRILTAFVDSDDDFDKNQFLDKSIDIPENKPISNPLNSSIFDNDSDKGEMENELLDLCSGRFDASQKQNSLSVTPFNIADTDIRMDGNLYSQTQGSLDLDQNELLGLCSGTFQTQANHSFGCSVLKTNTTIDASLESNTNLVKNLLESSGEEDDNIEHQRIKLKKRKKRNYVNDDEDQEENNENVADSNSVNDEFELDDDEVERFIDYDSDENEIEVLMTKKDRLKKASTFFENEAELSESEWGSADEDEKDMDNYEKDLADEEQFDQVKLQRELEQIHMRRVLDQDLREVKILKEMLFEDEERDGVGRERKFRWRNSDAGFSLDDRNENDESQFNNDEEESEEHWRKMRFDREKILSEKLQAREDLEEIESTLKVLSNSSSLDISADLLKIKKQINLIKTKTLTKVEPIKQNSSFLITKQVSTLKSNRESFLKRDQETLKRLVNLTKNYGEMEGSGNVLSAAPGKSRNYVFTSKDPEEVEQKLASKRKSDVENTVQNEIAPKKQRISINKTYKPRKSILDML